MKDHSIQPSQPETRAPDPERKSSQPAFWNERYEGAPYLFGTAPSAFLLAEAHRIPPRSDLVELGAGEGRNLIYLAGRGGHRITAVDFSAPALQKAQQLARTRNVTIETVEADVRTWMPERQWDAALACFLHLLPDERSHLYWLIQDLLRPGGWFLAEWFRPDHARGRYARIGPSATDRLVSEDELRYHFPASGIRLCKEADVYLSESPVLRGNAAVIRFVWQKER